MLLHDCIVDESDMALLPVTELSSLLSKVIFSRKWMQILRATTKLPVLFPVLS